jgi:hypothetical protein
VKREATWLPLMYNMGEFGRASATALRATRSGNNKYNIKSNPQLSSRNNLHHKGETELEIIR